MLFAQRMPPEGLLCMGGGFIIGVVIGLAVSAVILRAAVSFFNKLAGGIRAPEAVPEPGFGKAMGISFVTGLVNFGVGIVLGLVGGAVRTHPLVVQAVSMPVSFLVMGALLAAMLPTTFGKGMVISLLNMAVILGIAILIVAVVIVPLGLAGVLTR